MHNDRINHRAALTRRLVAEGAFAKDPLVLADVGASGGIGRHWRQFEPALKAYGFDPLVHECERLNAAERNPGVRYHACFVGFERYAELLPAAGDRGWSNQPFERTSAAAAQRLDAITAPQWFNYGNPDVLYAERRTSLERFFAEQGEPSVDFIKVDTDGHDYEVLCGAGTLLKPAHALGILVEAQFHGFSHPHANLFANIDRLLRDHGFSLFDLTPYRYTRAALPGRFVMSAPSDTLEGQVVVADALYLRDPAAPGYDARWGALAHEKLLKLLCLFEIHGFPDCAVELIQARPEAFVGRLDAAQSLDRLSGQTHLRGRSHSEITGAFAKSRELFYPRSILEILRRRVPSRLRAPLAAVKRRFWG